MACALFIRPEMFINETAKVRAAIVLYTRSYTHTHHIIRERTRAIFQICALAANVKTGGGADHIIY